MQDGSRVLSILLQASEKAANIARVCRQNETLFKILVQEKCEEEKNPRFFSDFKTLADVLIQETIRHDIETEFPELGKIVQGEENNVFSNTLGETVIVEVRPTCDETASLLARVMGGDETTANLLATEVHRDICLSDVPIHSEVPSNFDVDIDDLGIWIDPIDSTADYINGGETIDEATGIHLNGLRCVTVLIGGYSKSTGLPILGVVNQPFHTNVDSRRAEDASVKSRLLTAGYGLVEAAGAGYKMLSVAIGHADAYVLSKGSTYRWDTCGPHALLRALGGDVAEYRTFVDDPDARDSSLKYLPGATSFANSAGLIAYRDARVLRSFKTVLCE